MANATTDQSGEKAGLGDIAEIFYAPRAVFARRSDGKFTVPYLALVILGVVTFYATKGLVQPAIDAEISRQMALLAARPGMTPEGIASATSMAQTFASVGIIAFYLIAPFLVGLFIWVVGKIARIQAVGTTAIMIATFSIFPRVIGGIVGAILAALMSEDSLIGAASLGVGPARFIDPSHTALVALASRFDLFILWGIVLIAIGLQAAAKATKGQAWATAIGVWLIGLILPMIGVLRS